MSDTPTPTVRDRLRTIREGLNELWEDDGNDLASIRRDRIGALRLELDEIATGRVIELPDDLGERIGAIRKLLDDAASEHRSNGATAPEPPPKISELFAEQYRLVNKGNAADHGEPCFEKARELLARIVDECRIVDHEDAIAIIDWMTTPVDDGGSEDWTHDREIAALFARLRGWLADLDSVTIPLDRLEWTDIAYTLQAAIETAEGIVAGTDDRDPAYGRAARRGGMLRRLFMAVPAEGSDWIVREKVKFTRRECMDIQDDSFLTLALASLEADATD